ncbi:MAG TPA: nuclear pore complex subunit [Bacteroidales bacterium]|nr:nuclear pore complex subunit [Bacteroidales bacterium]
MNNLLLKNNDKWPIIDFNASTGVLKISGKSIPSDVHLVYDPIINWLKEYAGQPALTTVMTVHLIYYNTSSSKYVLDIFKILDKINAAGHSVKVNWLCDTEDEDLKEEGELYKSLVQVPFNVVSAVS